ncbi:hypothetical protein C8Q80DRAFT_1219017 [Daedaleopsis nitida]|nr:hypothetical protein C8Q80DRAFT_1219017 [Daedaleopsis nitida]
MKRGRKAHYTFYDDLSADSEADDDDDGPTPQRTEVHTHVDWTRRDTGPSARTTYHDLPASPTKRRRAQSLPPPTHSNDFVDLLYDPEREAIDLDYLYQQIEDLKDDPQPRKRTAGDNPVLQWIPEADAYLAELLRLEGRGDFTTGVCQCGGDALARYRCDDCADVRLHCEACVLSLHRDHPLHRIKSWDNEKKFFSRVTLAALGLNIQLGHPPGEPCICPRYPWGKEFVIIDTSGVHEVNLTYCGCERAQPHYIQLLRARLYPATSQSPRTAATFQVLELFHLLSAQSKVSAFDFYSTLSRRTDNTGLFTPRDRYPALLNIMRQWRHLKMMKRAGRGHDPSGIAVTPEGSCVVDCPACPHPGKNLPPDWETAPKEKRLYIAMDANFRLKRKKVSSDEVDPGLNHGYAYVVEEKAYKAHLAKHSDLVTKPSDLCNNHDAVKLAHAKGGPHLAATGVASVDCARHEMKRPCSTADIQAGERHVNMDYVQNSSLRRNAPRRVHFSYHVNCIYKINIGSRYAHYGWEALSENYDIEWCVPRFHINAHKEFCRAQYNLLFIPFSGRYDGEAIERLWSRTNGIAASTKEMGPGSRRDLLDDVFGCHNWQKVVLLPTSLLTRIKKAVPERNAQVIAFQQYHAVLPADATSRWKLMVETWENNRSQSNPYLVKRPAITQAAIKRQLAEEDAEAHKAGTAVVLHDRFTASNMIVAGMELEDAQRHLKTDIAAMSTHATDLQRAKMQERQNMLQRRIDSWFTIQQLYTPSVVTRRSRMLEANESVGHTYNLPLLLPSATLDDPSSLSSDSLKTIEWRLRYAQAFDSLCDLRGHLEVRTHLYKHKDRFARGQRANTRAQTVIKQVDGKINADVERYHTAYDTLQALAAPLSQTEWRRYLRPLLAGDVRHITEGEDGQSEGRRTMSWIWQACATPVQTGSATDVGDMNESLQESLRIEWCQARARAFRWTEEVDLLQEEMGRTTGFHEWLAGWWMELVSDSGVFLDKPDYREGADAYARRQASLRLAMRDHCLRTWKDVSAWVHLGEEEQIDSDSDDELIPIQPLPESDEDM